jgi:small subunit ribosomal protein S5
LAREIKEAEALQERIVHIARVAKVVKGGRRFSFSALVAIGDGKDKVGFGLGKAGEVPDAIRKGADNAKKEMMSVPLVNGTIPFDVIGKFGSAEVLMFPAKKGKGIIAGGAVRTIVELAGVRDIVCKVHGTKNSANVVRATIDGLKQLVTADVYAARVGKSVEDFAVQAVDKSKKKKGTKE